MTKLFAAGDLVNVPPVRRRPVHRQTPPHARVAAVLPPAADEEPSYTITLLAVSANCGLYGLFPAHRLAPLTDAPRTRLVATRRLRACQQRNQARVQGRF